MPVFQGRIFYGKIVGKPHPGYDKSLLEWSMDLCINATQRKEAIKMGIGDYVKNKGDERGDFISFKRPSVRRDGTPATPIRIVDKNKKPWDQGTLIGNESIVNVNFALNEKAKGGLKPSLIAVQVWEHIPYVGKPMDDEFPMADSDSGVEDWSEDAA